MVVGVRVESENITTGTKRHCNSSYFTMVAKDEQGKGMTIPGLLVENTEGARRFARSKRRKEEAFSRDTQFDSSKFKIEEHMEFLEGENIKLSLR